MTVAFLFPSTPAVRFTAAKLLETGYEVLFYCPEKIDLDLTENMIFECNIIGKEQSLIRNTDNPFSVQQHKDLSGCDFIGNLFIRVGFCLEKQKNKVGLSCAKLGSI